MKKTSIKVMVKVNEFFPNMRKKYDVAKHFSNMPIFKLQDSKGPNKISATEHGDSKKKCSIDDLVKAYSLVRSSKMVINRIDFEISRKNNIIKGYFL